MRNSLLNILFIISAGALTTPAYSLTFTVNNTDESGPGSLRQAIIDANNNAGPDIIDFNAGLNGKTIYLNNQEDALPAISDALSITGPGSRNLTLDGGLLWITPNGNVNADDPARRNDPGYVTLNDGDHIFIVDDGDPATDIDVTISGLTLINGNEPVYPATNPGPYPDGGAVVNFENLTLEQMFLNRNDAVNGGGEAVYAEDGSILIDHSHIRIGVGGAVTAAGLGDIKPVVEIRNSNISDTGLPDWRYGKRWAIYQSGHSQRRRRG